MTSWMPSSLRNAAPKPPLSIPEVSLRITTCSGLLYICSRREGGGLNVKLTKALTGGKSLLGSRSKSENRLNHSTLIYIRRHIVGDPSALFNSRNLKDPDRL